jgi:isopenicillin N synthase-like dioxygenase
MADVPTIDIAPARDGPSGLARVARDVGLAARDIGFFSVAGHGVPQGLVAEMFAAAHSFFALPASAKAELAIEKSPQYLGYARMAFEKLDPSRPGDAKESFNMGSERAADDPDLLAGKPFVGRNQWPESRAFRATMLQYFEALLAVGLTVHRAIATDLGLPADYFAHAYERSLSALRVLRYPPHPGTFDGKQFGAGPHTDYGGVTLLAQDDVAGLEVRRGGGGGGGGGGGPPPPPPQPGTFVCNIGDAMMRWTNDVYVSNAHRVVNRSGRERYSAAFFCEPNPDAVIACLPGCAAPGAPAKYPPIAFSDYLRSKLEPTYA